MTLTFLLDYQQISRTDKSVVVAGSVNYLRAKFSPKSDDWKLPVTALFNGTAVLLDENWECAVPWEVVQQAGTFTVSAFCGSLQTANTVIVPVVASGYKNGETPPEPTPDVYNQILGVMQEAKDAAETAQEAAGIAQDAAEHAPTIIDGVWHKWDAEAGEYNSTGMQAQGPEGERGPKGDKGDKGDRGDKGDKGDTGAQGPIGPTGETGPVGPKGEKGDTGSQGPQGVPGTAATITIGSVTESAPGGDASVTNSGTASAAVLDFVIPRGETGPTGATGATGPAGLGVPQPTAEDAGKIPVVNADGSGYELGNPAPEVDDTLSIPGAPADAAATGAAIEAVTPDDDAVGEKPWSSLQIIDTLCPPLEVTGNPVQCYPVAGYPLGVKASWEPVQEGSGTPSPENIRPIKGRDSVKVERCGENVIEFLSTEDTSSDIKIAVDAEKNITLNGTLAEKGNVTIGTCRLHWVAGKTYTMYIKKVGGSASLGSGDGITFAYSLFATDLVHYFRGDTTSTNLDEYMASNAALVETELIFMLQCWRAGTVFNNYKFQIEVVEGATTPTTYKPYIGQTNTLTLTETIYGGTVDAVTGEGVETWTYLVFDGTEDWYQNDQNGYFVGNVVDIGPDGRRESKSNIAVNSVDKIFPIPNGQFNTWSFTTQLGWVGFSLSFADSLDSWKSYLAAQSAAGTPVTIAYKLATPEPFQATGGQPLPALPGTNTIYTDADSVTVTGRADPNHTINALNDRIAALEDAATGG